MSLIPAYMSAPSLDERERLDRKAVIYSTVYDRDGRIVSSDDPSMQRPVPPRPAQIPLKMKPVSNLAGMKQNARRLKLAAESKQKQLTWFMRVAVIAQYALWALCILSAMLLVIYFRNEEFVVAVERKYRLICVTDNTRGVSASRMKRGTNQSDPAKGLSDTLNRLYFIADEMKNRSDVLHSAIMASTVAPTSRAPVVSNDWFDKMITILGFNYPMFVIFTTLTSIGLLMYRRNVDLELKSIEKKMKEYTLIINYSENDDESKKNKVRKLLTELGMVDETSL